MTMSRVSFMKIAQQKPGYHSQCFRFPSAKPDLDSSGKPIKLGQYSVPSLKLT